MKKWLLLDNCSSTDVFCNESILTNIRKVNETMSLSTNAGTVVVKQKGTLPGYGDVWFSKKAITNCLSLRNVKKKGFHVSYDSKSQDKFVARKGNTVMSFTPHPNGLYHLDMTVNEVAFVATVEENEKEWSPRQVARAKKARALYQSIGTPSIRDFKAIVQANMIKNCPVTVADINIAEKIYGPAINVLKGKTTRKKPPPVVVDYLEVPKSLRMKHQGVELCADLMFVQGVAFLITISKHIKFITIRCIPSRTLDELRKAFDETFRIYNKFDFRVDVVHADPEFQKLRQDLADNDIELNVANPQEHVPEMERCIRTEKERFRSQIARMPFQGQMPVLMFRELGKFVTRWLNSFPPKGGVSQTYSPRAVVTGRAIDYKKHCLIPFGSYVEATMENTPTNSMLERTISGIYLGSRDVHQGGHNVMNLSTGRLIQRAINAVKPLPMPKAVIDRVKQLGAQQGIKPNLQFKVRKQGKFVIEEDALITGVEDAPPNPEEQARFVNSEADDEEDDDSDYEEFEDEDDDDEDDDTLQWNQRLTDSEDDEEADEEDDDTENMPTAPTQPLTDEDTIEGSDDEQAPDTIEIVDEQETEQDDQTIETAEAPTLRRSNRTRHEPLRLEPTLQGQSYQGAPDAMTYEVNHLITQTNVNHVQVYEPSEAPILATIVHQFAFAETFSLNKGLKKFGEKGENAAFQEVEQLHQRNCWKPIHPNDLSPEQRKKALESLIFLTEKRDGRIKGRACANGSKQRLWMSKEDSASPTVSQEAVMLTAAIEAHENREVAIVDIPNAFIQTDHKGEKVHMKIRGKLAEILVSVAPKLYEPFVTKECGHTVLYVELLKALYGCIESPLLFYRKLRKDLESQGFVVNPYDPCVANKMIDGKQMTVTWHVDDLKVSHVNPKVVDQFIDWIKKTYGKVTEVKPSRGKVHDYLAMKLNYETPGEVKVDMSDCVVKMVDEFPGELSKGVKTPAADHLMMVNPNALKLPPEKAEVFHTIVAKGLFLCKRARPDIQPTIAFLCTRVKEPDVDDWKKLSRLITYLHNTKDDCLTLKIDNLNTAVWFADAAFAVHKDMKSHTGGVMSMGKGAILSQSNKQKLNTKSSTEAELVAADEITNLLLWTKHFLDAQGYKMSHELQQDNQSAIQLENNGRDSAGKRSRHLDIRFFFIKDRIQNKDLTVKFCPTDQMVADFMTKPLQGKKFHQFRKWILNLKN